MKNDKEKSKNSGCLGILILFVILALIVIFNSTDDNDYSYNNNSETSSESISKSSSVSIKYSKVSLNVRKSPNEKSRVLKVLKPNEKVTTNGKQENGFTQILDSSNRNYGWCSTKYLQDTPLSESQLEEIELRNIENRTIDYRINEKKDIGLNRFNCKIVIQVDKIPNNDELLKLALKIWGNGYKHWDVFNLWMYLPDMDTNFSAYCFFEFSRNGLNNFEYFSKRKSGEKIYTQNELKTEIKTPDTIIISNTGKKYIELTKNNVNIKLSPDNNSLTIANGFKGDIFSLDSIQSGLVCNFFSHGRIQVCKY